MSQILLPGQDSTLQPRIVTLAQLRAILTPFCQGNKWAEGAITDLWKMGAPVPQPEGAPERRILIPEKFALWWQELSQRMGYSAPAHRAYQPLQRTLPTTAGHRQTVKR